MQRASPQRNWHVRKRTNDLLVEPPQQMLGRGAVRLSKGAASTNLFLRSAAKVAGQRYSVPVVMGPPRAALPSHTPGH